MQEKTKWDKDLKTITFSWDKGCNYLNFRAVVYVDAKHRKTALIDGGVSRAFDSYRYEISSCASPQFIIKDYDGEFIGPKENRFNEWYYGVAYEPDAILTADFEQLRFRTIAEAVSRHFETQWGITLDEEFVRDQLIPAIPKEDEMVVRKIITDWMMNEAKFKGTKTQKRKIATDIAKNMVWDGSCFTDVGYMETNDYGLLNISGERVFEEWDYQTGKAVA